MADFVYKISQKIYIVEFDKTINDYKIYERLISRADIHRNRVDYYAALNETIDDFRISEYDEGYAMYAKKESPNGRWKNIVGNVFLTEETARQYIEKVAKNWKVWLKTRKRFEDYIKN